MMLAIRHITSLSKVIRAIEKIEQIKKIADMIFRRPRESSHEDQTAILLEMKRILYRKEVLEIVIAYRARDGFKVESQSDFQAVFVKGHLLWKQRELVQVDECVRWTQSVGQNWGGVKGESRHLSR